MTVVVKAFYNGAVLLTVKNAITKQPVQGESMEVTTETGQSITNGNYTSDALGNIYFFFADKVASGQILTFTFTYFTNTFPQITY